MKNLSREEMFKKIQDAYEILSNPLARRKYDAALIMMAASKNNESDFGYQTDKFYRPPLRCGLIMATGHYEVGRFVVEKIMQWEPIKKGNLELVTSWDKDKNEIAEDWI